MLSDFMASGYEQTLRITGNKHDLTGIRVYDPREAEIPNVGLISVQDSESGKIQLVNTQSAHVRRTYNTNYLKRVDYFRDSFAKAGCGILDCRVDESYVKKLLGYFKRRA